MNTSHFIGNNVIFNGNIKLADAIEYSLPSSETVLYEILRVINGKPLFLKDHFERLEQSFSKVYCKSKFPLSLIELRDHIISLSETNSIYNQNIELSLICNDNGECNCIIGFIASKYPDKDAYSTGVSTCLLHEERTNPNIKAKGLKVRDNANKLIAEKGVFEVLLVNKHGVLTEGSRSNLFIVIGDTIHTATDEKVLLGVTRKYVSAIIKKSGYNTAKQINYKDLHKIDGAFITGTSIGVMPLNRIDDINIDPQNQIVQNLVSKYKELESECAQS